MMMVVFTALIAVGILVWSICVLYRVLISDNSIDRPKCPECGRQTFLGMCFKCHPPSHPFSNLFHFDFDGFRPPKW